jgi:hypothetical protein
LHTVVGTITVETRIATRACAGDTLGNVALLDIDGKEIWEKHVKSMLGQVGPVAAVQQALCPGAP